MLLQTTVQIKGVLDGIEQTCTFSHDQGPEAIFRGRTAREVFLQSVSNPGCSNIQDKDLKIHINVRRDCAFGFAGFTENNVQNAIKKARELEAKCDDDLLEQGMPDPEALFISAVKALSKGDEATAYALADTFEFFAERTLGFENGKGTGKLFVAAAAKMAEEIIRENKTY